MTAFDEKNPPTIKTMSEAAVGDWVVVPAVCAITESWNISVVERVTKAFVFTKSGVKIRKKDGRTTVHYLNAQVTSEDWAMCFDELRRLRRFIMYIAQNRVRELPIDVLRKSVAPLIEWQESNRAK